MANSAIDMKQVQPQKNIIMGKQKKALANTLDYGENLKLKNSIMNECKKYQQLVRDKFPDQKDRSIMMSEEDTKMKNEILRKVKYQKMKNANLTNFVRIERQKILQ